MNIAIFGSCVSRDTCEFIPDAKVLVYVARHSVTSLESPHGTKGVDISGLDSAFQKRMVTSDLQGSGIAKIVKAADGLDLVLLDLVDERRGYWLFSDGTTMTNSIEIESCGAARDARRAGARLVQFGSEEHFEAWRNGFSRLVDALRNAGLWQKTVFLDIEWAQSLDGAQHPKGKQIAKIRRGVRRLQRGFREATRSLSRGEPAHGIWSYLRHVQPTEAEIFADRAAAANLEYLRYRRVARSEVADTIRRRSDEVRISRDHKWGPEPFHYRNSDYVSIVQSLKLESLKKLYPDEKQT